VLVVVTVTAMAAYVTQFVVQHIEGAPDLNISNWIGRSPQPLAGVAPVIDGDTIEIHGQRIRFNGIDAPESAQQCDDAKGFRYQCGAKAGAALDGFLAASRPVTCEFVAWDRYGRFVGDCRRADGTSVAAWMVEHGQALDWPTALTRRNRPRRRRRRSVCGPEHFRHPGNGALGMRTVRSRLPANR
jgi:endonuclease YncB( thermonuclease family)